MTITHRMKGTPTYNSWILMKVRCLDAKSTSYKYYGAKGITLCDSWRRFENFLADMGVRPEGKTLDRIDNSGDYTPENCKWSTPAQQARNRSSTVFLTHNGETLCMKDWADRIGVTVQAIWVRINVRKLPLEIALSRPRSDSRAHRPR